MAMHLKKDLSFKKWFDLPDGSARIELCEKSEADLYIVTESLFAKASIGGNISYEIESTYLDSISDWQGIEDEEGKPLKLTPANKRLFFHQPGMYMFMRESMASLRDEAVKERESAEKN